MKKNVIIALLILATLGLAGLSLYQCCALKKYCTLKKNQGEAPVEVRSKSEASTEPIPPAKLTERPSSLLDDERLSYQRKIEELRDKLAESKAEVEALSSASSKAVPPDKPNPIEILRDPEMREMIRNQQKETLDDMYGSLFSYLALEAEALESLKKFLVDKTMVSIEMGMVIMNLSLTEEEKVAARQENVVSIQEIDQEIKAFLGEEKYGIYEEFEETQPERMQVNHYKQSLGSSLPLNEEKEHQLVRAMYEERSVFPFSTDFYSPANMDAMSFTPERINQHLEETAQLEERYLLRAKTILSPEQLGLFNVSLKQQRAMQKDAMKQAVELYGP
ncbi:MAG: hypothetical protein GKR87_07920 [Kiritimatiellae bacterium]|nr:hypothetical protein [Kiritimatiellia bacterium]